VVARDDRHRAVGTEASANGPQHRLGELECSLVPALHQLDHVAEQDQPIDRVQRHEQASQRLGATQDVVPEPGAEMEVGYD
jgi:hypothetical protein